jgi:hypothetical protein
MFRLGARSQALAFQPLFYQEILLVATKYEDLVAQAHRLLRVKWESPVSLAEELYAMLLPDVGTDIPEEAEASEQPAAVAEVQRRLEQAQQFFSNIDQSATIQNVKATVAPPVPLFREPTAIPQLGAPVKPEEIPVRPIEVPTFPLLIPPFLTIPPVQSAPPPIPALPPITPFSPPPPVPPTPFAYSRPDLHVPRLPDVDWTLPVNGVPIPADTGTGGGVMGKVVSGSGDTYIVDLYEAGKNSAATQTGITVFVEQIDPDDAIPPDTWIAPVIQVTSDAGDTEFWFQPATWVN